MGGLLKAGSGFRILKKWTSSSRPREADALDRLENRGAGMSAKQRAAFLARESAKETSGNGLQANTPLSSRYA
jgi:hypothetical protein